MDGTNGPDPLPFARTIGDSSLDGAGGFSIVLRFWWHLSFPDEVIQHTLRFKSDSVDATLISINIFEFVMVDYKLLCHTWRSQDNPRHGRSSSHPSQHHGQYFCIKLDHPHLQTLQALSFAYPFLLFTVDEFASWHQLTVDQYSQECYC
jgi:hypothetical protein